jgi:hypothetical protein
VPEMLPGSTLNFMAQVHPFYASLMGRAPASQEPDLGGQLLYVGELDETSRALAVAANIAGAATLAASALPAALRHSQREGSIDFVVNSLDEALRILKNEIRKHEPVAVAVSLAPEVIEAAMLDRGVLPNLLPPRSGPTMQTSTHALFLAQRAHQIPAPNPNAKSLFIWSAPAEYAKNLAGFESMLANHLTPEDRLNRRWLRLSPRYLGPAARRLRSVACDSNTANALIKLLGPPINYGSTDLNL